MLHFKNTVHALAMSNGPSVSMTTYTCCHMTGIFSYNVMLSCFSAQHEEAMVPQAVTTHCPYTRIQ